MKDTMAERDMAALPGGIEEKEYYKKKLDSLDWANHMLFLQEQR